MSKLRSRCRRTGAHAAARPVGLGCTEWAAVTSLDLLQAVDGRASSRRHPLGELPRLATHGGYLGHRGEPADTGSDEDAGPLDSDDDDEALLCTPRTQVARHWPTSSTCSTGPACASSRVAKWTQMWTRKWKVLISQQKGRAGKGNRNMPSVLAPIVNQAVRVRRSGHSMPGAVRDGPLKWT